MIGSKSVDTSTYMCSNRHLPCTVDGTVFRGQSSGGGEGEDGVELVVGDEGEVVVTTAFDW